MSGTFPRRLVVGIAGGTGSGKSTVAEKIMAAVGEEHVSMLDQDSYYKDLSGWTLEQKRRHNFDHPDAIEFALMREHLDKLRQGVPVLKPVYSFHSSTRTGEHTQIKPSDVIIVEGILILWDEQLRDRMDIKVFVDTDDDIRMIRRLLRDIRERSRTVERVVDQYMQTVRPSHLTFVEPTKRYADIIIPEGGMNQVAVSMVVATLKHWLTDKAGTLEGVIN
jgi:uridine kinase